MWLHSTCLERRLALTVFLFSGLCCLTSHCVTVVRKGEEGERGEGSSSCPIEIYNRHGYRTRTEVGWNHLQWQCGWKEVCSFLCEVSCLSSQTISMESVHWLLYQRRQGTGCVQSRFRSSCVPGSRADVSEQDALWLPSQVKNMSAMLSWCNHHPSHYRKNSALSSYL